MKKKITVLFAFLFFYSNAQQKTIDSLTTILNNEDDLSLEHKKAKANWEIALLYYDLRKEDSIIKYSKISLDYAKANKLRYELFDMLANVYSIKKEYNIATVFIDSSLIVAKRLSNKKYVAKVHYRLGKNLKYLKSYKASEENLKKSLELSLVHNTKPRNLGSIYRELGRLYKRTKQYSLSIENYNQSIVHYEKVKRYKTIASIYDDISALYIAMKNYDEAREYVKKALDIRKIHNIKKDDEVTYSRLGRLYYLGNNKSFDSSYYYLNKAERIYRENKSLDNLRYLEFYYFSHFQLQKKTDSATTHINKYIVYSDSINKNINREALAKVNAELDVYKKELENQTLRAQTAEQKNELQNKRINNLILLFLSITTGIGIIFLSYLLTKRNKQRKQSDFKYQKELDELKQEKADYRDVIANQHTTINNLEKTVAEKQEFISLQLSEKENSFHNDVLKTNYKLTKGDLEYWIDQSKGLTERQMSAKYSVAKSTIESKGKRLRSKIKFKKEIDSKISLGKEKMLRIYKEEWKEFHK